MEPTVLDIILPALFFGVFAGMFAWPIVLVYSEKMKEMKQWKKVEQLPGLENLGLLTSGQSMAGQIKGVNVRISWSAFRQVTIEALIEPPMDLGLKIEHAGTNASHELYVADNAYAAHFATFATEKDRALALLNPKLRRDIVAYFAHLDVRDSFQFKFSLSDDGARLVMMPHSLSSAFNKRNVQRDIMHLVSLVRYVNRRRKKLHPAPRLRAHHQKWAAFAEKNGFECSTTPLGLSGVAEGATIQAHAIKAMIGGARLVLALKFNEPLGLGLSLRPFGLVDRVATAFGGEDHRMDDPDFDDTFRVTTQDHQGTDLLLDDEVRQSLLILQATLEPISLSDEALSIRLSRLPEDPIVVIDLVRQLKGLATKIEERRRHTLTRGPYR